MAYPPQGVGVGGDMFKAVYDPDRDGKIALDELELAVCSETEADAKITTHKGDAGAHHNRYTDAEARTIAVIPSETLRNTNDAQKGTTSTSYVKLKEVKLNADLAGCRLKASIKISNATGPAAYYKVYKNGVAIGPEHLHGGDLNWKTFSDNFTGWLKNDLIQLYVKSSTGAQTASVKNMRFYYSNGISHIGGEKLVTTIEITGDPTISMTNQDP